MTKGATLLNNNRYGVPYLIFAKSNSLVVRSMPSDEAVKMITARLPAHQLTVLPHQLTALPHQLTALPHQQNALPHQLTALSHQLTVLPHHPTALPHQLTALSLIS